jgi:undecaprenyl-diphosphatase
MFEVIIQLGSILAVVTLYWRKLLDKELIKRLIVAFIPTGIIGLLLHKMIKNLYDQNKMIIITLFVGGLVIILFEMWHKEKETDTEDLTKITYKQSLVIGFFQSIAIIPGVSRSAATIIGGLAMKIKRRTIVEFSFLLAVPTMIAASGLDLVSGYKNLGGGNLGLLVVGFIASFIVSALSIKLLLGFIRRYNFTSFGVYRILVAVVFWLLII